jgi:hypothetical protein
MVSSFEHEVIRFRPISHLESASAPFPQLGTVDGCAGHDDTVHSVRGEQISCIRGSENRKKECKEGKS